MSGALLDQMVAGTAQQKRDKAVTLTPVGTEVGAPMGRSRIPDVPEVFLTGEALTDIAKDLRRQAEVLLAVADGLDRHVTGKDAEAPAPVVDQKAVEQAADTRVRTVTTPQTEALIERLTALSDKAKADTFAQNDAPIAEATEAASGSPASGWTCPTHGDAHLNELVSRKGRKYRACTACTDFEK